MALYNPSNTLSVTKAAIAQLISKGYMSEDYTLDALDDSAIVDLGEKLEITENGDFTINSPADIVFKAFVSALGKIVIDTRSYVAKLPSLYVDTVNWGLFTETVTIDLSDVMIDEMWNPDGYIPWNTPADPLTPTVYPGQVEGARIAAIEHGFYRPAINAKLYKKAHGIMVALTTMYDQLFTAFRGAAELNEFLAGLYNSVENTIQLKAEVYAKMTVSMGIAVAAANNNVIDLRQIAIDAGITDADTLTVAELLDNADFLKLALETISETREYIRDYSALFNDGDMATFASDEKMILLTKFAKKCKFNVRANTYNEQLLGIGDYDTINMWQAATTSDDSTPYNFTAASSIDLAKAAAVEAGLIEQSSEETHVLLPNIIGVVYDRLAMGINIDKKKVTTNYTASRDTVNTFYHALERHVVNSHYPIVVFTITDPEGD
ncbi:MAG: hypothetical protein J6R30_08390 [Bacteroidales bacterium]|nr:hypothetical protein [Bacteroidales bacterium]